MKVSSIISSKGQIVIPANLRKRYGLMEGTTVVFQEDRGRLVLEPSNHAAIYACKELLRTFRSNSIWLTKDKRTRSEKTRTALLRRWR